MILDIPQIKEGQKYEEGLSYKLFGSKGYDPVFTLVMRNDDGITKIRFELDGVCIETHDLVLETHGDIDCGPLISELHSICHDQGLLGMGNMREQDWSNHVGDGWKPMVKILLMLCNEHDVSVLEVKEKLGGLRFYYGGDCPTGLQHLISSAEMISYYICERCGKQGNLREDLSWLLTLCDECHTARLEEINARN